MSDLIQIKLQHDLIRHKIYHGISVFNTERIPAKTYNFKFDLNRKKNIMINISSDIQKFIKSKINTKFDINKIISKNMLFSSNLNRLLVVTEYNEMDISRDIDIAIDLDTDIKRIVYGNITIKSDIEVKGAIPISIKHDIEKITTIIDYNELDMIKTIETTVNINHDIEYYANVIAVMNKINPLKFDIMRDILSKYIVDYEPNSPFPVNKYEPGTMFFDTTRLPAIQKEINNKLIRTNNPIIKLDSNIKRDIITDNIGPDPRRRRMLKFDMIRNTSTSKIGLHGELYLNNELVRNTSTNIITPYGSFIKVDRLERRILIECTENTDYIRKTDMQRNVIVQFKVSITVDLIRVANYVFVDENYKPVVSEFEFDLSRFPNHNIYEIWDNIYTPARIYYDTIKKIERE